MAYCTIAQLTDRYGTALLRELTDRADVATGSIDETVLNRAIADADAVIDGYLRGRYSLPLTSTPALLVDLSLVISIYKAHANVASEKIRKDYDDAIKTLTQISNGTVRLPDVAGAEPAGSGAAGVRITDRDRPFTHDNLKGY